MKKIFRRKPFISLQLLSASSAKDLATYRYF